MTLLDLVKKAEKGYTRDFPESSLLEFVDAGRPLNPMPSGDTLAAFVVRELSDTYDLDASEESQLEQAANAMKLGADNLYNTMVAVLEGF